METDEGLWGYGEATVAFDLGAPAAFEMICEMAPGAIGMDPIEHEVVWEKLFTGSFWTQSGGTILMSALSAIDTALWDIKAKAMGAPLYWALGGKFRDALRCYASQTQFGWGDQGMGSRGWRPEDITQTTLQVVEEGYGALKVNPIHFDGAGGRLGMVRGPPADLRSMEQIRTRGGIPLAAGERLHGSWPYLQLLEKGAVDVVQPDVGTCGGITQAKKICDMAYSYGRTVQLHVCGSPIAMAASMHLEAAIPNFAIHEHMVVGKDRQNAALGRYDYQPAGGSLQSPTCPALARSFQSMR